MDDTISGASAEVRRRAHRRARWCLAGVALLASLYLAGTYAAPLLRAQESSLGTFLHWAYAPTCHQMPERSMAIEGLPQAVCARCSGLYIGGVAALWAGLLLVVGRVKRLPGWWFFAACAPTVLDALLGIVGLPQLPMGPRLGLAVPAGFVAGLFLALGVAEIASPRRVPAASLAPSTSEFQPGGTR